ncbi:uncharacterized protein LOC129803490 [Phlebotomus papatasi]|uniref:uncharacterized protein LOC129803490 n=1 Tax=Phlebotomus papatasi TaxID=29031 RepID=UPI002483C050|nr:uncharacterized protein LOC129803490 [Phlebotomus papatasi]
MSDKDKIIFGGKATIDFSKSFGSVGELLYYYLNKNQDNAGIIDGLTGRKVFYRAIKEKALNLAEFFRQIGIKEGDVIGICSENRLEFSITLYGALFIGATIVGINYFYNERELTHTIQLTQPKMIFVSEYAIEKILNLSKKFSFIENIVQYGDIVLVDGVRAFEDIFKDKRYIKPEEEFAYPSKDLNRNALILMSSGTTGLTKAVQITEWNLMATLGYSKESRNGIDKNKELVVMSATQWFHPFGLIGQICCAVEGVTLVFLKKFEDHRFLKCIEKYKVTHCLMIPPMMFLFANSPLIMDYDLSSLQDLYCGAAYLSEKLETDIISRLPNLKAIRQGYGLSETTFGILNNDGLKKTKLGSVGIVALETYGKVIDIESGKILGPNQPGELCFKGPQIMKGYLGNDAATKEAIDSEGWLHTGDLGYYDEDKYFFFVDRIKELIKYKTYQVPPAELEALLLSHPKIADSAVIGLPDEAAGELPLAFVVRKPNEKITEKQVMDYISEIVSDFKQLRGGVRFVTEIPRNATGKILRRELKNVVKSLSF